MATTTLQIAELLPWSEAKQVETKNGPRNLRKAAPTEEFWALWRAEKAALRAVGLSCSQFKGQWEVCWWQEIPGEAEKHNEALAASRATDTAVAVPCPEGLDYFGYQAAGIAYCQGKKAVLIADEMGLGKTIQAVGRANGGPREMRILVIVPASLKTNWAREWERWDVHHRDVHVVSGKGSFPKAQAAQVVILNYDIASKFEKEIKQSGTWDLVIFDEGHYLKNAKAARTKFCLGARTLVKGDWKVTPCIPHRAMMFLTGTPIVNRPAELWPMLRHLDPDGLGKSWKTYHVRYCAGHQNAHGWDVSGASNLPELQSRLRSKCMVRRLKANVLKELPPKTRQIVTLDTNGMPADMLEDIRAMENKVEQEWIDAKAAVEAVRESECNYNDTVETLQEGARVAFNRLSSVRHDTALFKLPYAIKFIKEHRECNEAPLLIFAHHQDVVDALKAEFPHAAVITGSTPTNRRQAEVDRFQNGDTDVFIGNIKAAGVGLNLTAASTVIFAELSWVPADLSQAEDRAHRIGQEDHVHVYHLVLDGTLDARMARKVIAKQVIYTSALDKGIPEAKVEEAKPQATTITVAKRKSPDKLVFTPEELDHLHHAMRTLAGICDGAQSLDGKGFNRFDTTVGHLIAAQPGLNQNDARLAHNLAIKYQRQLSDETLAGCRITRKES